MPARHHIRSILTGLTLIPIVWVGVLCLNRYFADEQFPRPNDFLQVWAAGRLTVTGENPYDAKQVYELQRANRNPTPHASMMWVPPWGLAVAAPIGVLPIDLAQVVWVFGQFGLIVALAVVLWWMHGGAMKRAWIAVVFALGCGPVWWQMIYGQYAGLLLLGLVGFLAAHRRNRPVLAGAFLFLIALKPHLFAPFAIGLIIDAIRTPFGRRVVLGGAIVLLAASGIATAINPHAWEQYLTATGAGTSEYAPGLSYWYPPTLPGLIRHNLPSHPFWIQFVPIALFAPAFAVYWWRKGSPERWPRVLLWLVPVQLLTAPYGAWSSDLTLLLIPTVALAARLDANSWQVKYRWPLCGVFAVTNIAVAVMPSFDVHTVDYVWAAPVLIACLLWAHWGLKPLGEPARQPAFEVRENSPDEDHAEAAGAGRAASA